jgi:hypothetical protein
MATWPTNPTPNPAQVRVEEAVYTELRIANLLLCRMATLLSQLVGPIPPLQSTSNNVVATWTPEDLSGDLDSLRSDPSMRFN